MGDLLLSYYPWIKSLHIIAVIMWMAGLLYLPRLFVYHADATPGSELAATLATMEYRLLRIIMNPAMIAVWILGPILMLTPGLISWSSDYWIYAKWLLVLVLTWNHHQCGVWRKQLAAGTCQRSAKFFRQMNEVPTVAIILIVILVVVQPF